MFVGIDVAKAELVVSMLPSAERFTVANDERVLPPLREHERVDRERHRNSPHLDRDAWAIKERHR